MPERVQLPYFTQNTLRGCYVVSGHTSDFRWAHGHFLRKNRCCIQTVVWQSRLQHARFFLQAWSSFNSAALSDTLTNIFKVKSLDTASSSSFHQKHRNTKQFTLSRGISRVHTQDLLRYKLHTHGISRISYGEGKHSDLFSTVNAKWKHATLSSYARLPGTRDTESLTKLQTATITQHR